jgi:hypothetical protein
MTLLITTENVGRKEKSLSRVIPLRNNRKLGKDNNTLL